MPKMKQAFFLFICSFLFTKSVAFVRQQQFKRGLLQLEKGKVLTGHVISSHHVVSPVDCSFLCTSNAQCLSYNYKPKGADDKDVCELNNATRKSDPGSYQDNALYIHYYDAQTEDAKSCLDYLRSGLTQNGIYDITNRSGGTYKVWCDLSSEPGSAWTLILSYAHKNRHNEGFCSVSFTKDKVRQNNNPNWENYRLGFGRMKSISDQSTHVRVTSSFPVHGVDYRDYLRAKISSVDILSFTGAKVCKTVEYIDIRGIKGKDITVPFWQNDVFFFHTDSSGRHCQYDATSGSVNSENNFGTTCLEFNPATRGSANDDSTIQYWFGGYL
ncbi:uncharacterized protein LOC116296679 [Actinia tenebrosa]|uniref:Uncharacterized protein LOC116296679 n=1 Tax=Actinia tenebrosa TaxID=6105 RepID=A0A6P8I7D0_ACTTE|nr:uncharacterized protein LOC116296679 [Actinia tenebrosa]